MKLFNNQTTDQYVKIRSQNIKNEIEKISDEEIINSDIEQWNEYLFDKYEINLITLFEDNIDKQLDNRKVRQYNHFYGALPFEKEYYDVDGMCITYKIPFDGESELLFLQPHTFMMSGFDILEYTPSTNTKYGYIILEFEYTKSTLESKGDNLQEFIKQNFEERFKDFRTMIGYVNLEMEKYNDSLEIGILQLLNQRKDKASSSKKISQILNIPLKENAYSTNTTPIPLKKVQKPRLNKPNMKIESVYVLKDDDFININNIIRLDGTAMEKTARSYILNNEEELRDRLLATLDTHYDNVTGETFRKLGKTDICIEFSNKAAFIGECKLWRGEKYFSEAIQQVINYSTWRDTKVSIIIFNKENKGFKRILETINEYIKINAFSSLRKELNYWQCKFFREDLQENIDVYIHVFDLYVDKTQLKDSRIK